MNTNRLSGCRDNDYVLVSVGRYYCAIFKFTVFDGFGDENLGNNWKLKNWRTVRSLIWESKAFECKLLPIFSFVVLHWFDQEFFCIDISPLCQYDYVRSSDNLLISWENIFLSFSRAFCVVNQICLSFRFYYIIIAIFTKNLTSKGFCGSILLTKESWFWFLDFFTLSAISITKTIYVVQVIIYMSFVGGIWIWVQGIELPDHIHQRIIKWTEIKFFESIWKARKYFSRKSFNWQLRLL